MAKALSLFYPLVLPHALGCSNPLLDQAILYAASQFCRDTHVVQEISTQNVVVGQQDYDVDVPSQQALTSLLGVWVNNTKLEPVATDQVDPGTAMRGSVGDFVMDAGAPVYYYQKNPSDPVFSLFPVADTAYTDGLAVRAAFEPAATATTLADVLYDQYADDIANGAIGYLLSIPGHAFSNPILGAEFTRRFNSGIGDTKSLARTGKVRRSLRVQPRAFA